MPPIEHPPAFLTGVQRKTITDRVQLPRLYIAWLTPAHFAPGDAALDVVAQVLAGGKNSRLYKRLVYDLQIAQDVSAFQASAALGSHFQSSSRRAPAGCDDDRRGSDERITGIVDEEIAKLQAAPPAAREVERAINQIEASFYNRMERVGGFGGKADQLNAYYTADRQSRLLQRGPLALPRAVAPATSRPPPRGGCRGPAGGTGRGAERPRTSIATRRECRSRQALAAFVAPCSAFAGAVDSPVAACRCLARRRPIARSRRRPGRRRRSRRRPSRSARSRTGCRCGSSSCTRCRSSQVTLAIKTGAPRSAAASSASRA